MFPINRVLLTKFIFTSVFTCSMAALLVLSLAPRASADHPSDDVKTVQQSLTDKGYNPGPVDGVMGSQTRHAIGQYQEHEGLKVTHHVDSDTADKLGVPQESTGDIFKSAGHHFEKGGKEFGHEIANGHPGEAGKDLGKGVGDGGKKTGEGVKQAVTPQ